MDVQKLCRALLRIIDVIEVVLRQVRRLASFTLFDKNDAPLSRAAVASEGKPPWPSLNRSLAVVTDTPRSFLQIVAHNLKLAANIDHMRDGTSNAPPEPRPPPIVP